MHMISRAAYSVCLTAEPGNYTAKVFMHPRTDRWVEPRFPIFRGKDDVIMQTQIGGHREQLAGTPLGCGCYRRIYPWMSSDSIPGCCGFHGVAMRGRFAESGCWNLHDIAMRGKFAERCDAESIPATAAWVDFDGTPRLNTDKGVPIPKGSQPSTNQRLGWHPVRMR